jgi:hypothetical protein
MSYLPRALRHNGAADTQADIRIGLGALDLARRPRRKGLGVDEKDCSDSGRNVIQVSD